MALTEAIKLLLLVPFALGTNCPFVQLDGKVLKTIFLEPRRVSNPLIVTSNGNGLTCGKKFVSKVMSSKAVGMTQLVRIDNLKSLTEIELRSPMVFLVENSTTFLKTATLITDLNLGTQRPVLILTKEFNQTMAEGTGFRINQHVLILSQTTLELTEVYSINTKLIVQQVGYYHFKSKWFQKAMQFDFNPNWKKSRDNFYGLHLVGMTEQLPPYTSLTEEFETESPFFKSNDTYDVTDFTSGMIFDIFNHLSRVLNFTFSLYKRNDGVWGTVVNNKTIGILSNLEDGSADLVVSAFSANLVRLPYVRHLTFLTERKPGLFIRQQPVEQMSWLIFFSPFSLPLWSVIFFTSLVTGFWFFLVSSQGTDQKVCTV